MLSFTDWQKSRVNRNDTGSATALSLPDWQYDASKYADSNELRTTDFFSDYYNQMTTNYLPSVDTFASDNMGKMVAFDPNKFMAIDDFGYKVGRGDLRGKIVPNATHELPSPFEGDPSLAFYDANGKPFRGGNGDEIFRQSRDEDGTLLYEPNDGPAILESAGTYKKDTIKETIDQLTAKGGGTAQGGYSDFMGGYALENLGKDTSSKFGKDPVNNPEVSRLLNDPNWVTRDDNGNVTNVRAELYPLLLREQLGEEFRDISRGGTERADPMGDLVKTVVLGAVTGGIGAGAAGALGLASGTLGNALATGALSGGLNSAVTGGDIGKGIVTGGVTGGLTKFASPYVGSALNGAGVTNQTLNKTLTGGIIGSGVNAVKGGNAGTGFLTGATTAFGQQLGNQAFGNDPSFLKNVAVGAGTGAVNSAITGRKYDPSSLLNGKNLMSFADWLSSQNG